MGTLILDSSAILAVLLPECDADAYITVLADATPIKISAVNYMEASIVYASRVESGIAFQRVDQFIFELEVIVEPVTATYAALAREAFLRYGKGRHPAGLNFGDCFAYALAKAHKVPLLFKGADFAKTDVISALP